MLRLKFELLESRNGTLYYQDKLFTGIVFKSVEGRITDSFYVANGILAKQYMGDYVKVSSGSMRLETDCVGLEGEREYGEEITLNGVPFDGILYEFDCHFCTGEAAFEKGRRINVSVEWHRNGVLCSYDNFSKGVGDAFDWYDNGELKNIFIVTSAGEELSAEFIESGQIRVLQITEKFFVTARQHTFLPFQTIEKPDDLRRYKVAPFLLLRSEGIDQNIFDILAGSGFDQLEIFKAFDTSLGGFEFARIAELPIIRFISVDDKHGRMHASALATIKELHPHVEVHFNDLKLPKRKPVPRLKVDAMPTLESTVLFKGKPFTGIAFEMNLGHLKEARYFKDGRPQGQYHCDYTQTAREVRLGNDCEGLTSDPVTELIQLHGVLFTGIVYEFNDRYCLRETEFVLGEICLDLTWYQTGLLAGYSCFYNSWNKIELSWHENEQLKRLHTEKKHGTSLTAECLPNGNLLSLSITDKFFSGDLSPMHKVPFELIRKPADLRGYHIGTTLSLSGLGVRPKVLEILWSEQGLSQLEIVSATHTSLGEDDFVKLAELPFIKKIDILDGTGAHGTALRKIKHQHPNIELSYNSSRL